MSASLGNKIGFLHNNFELEPDTLDGSGEGSGSGETVVINSESNTVFSIIEQTSDKYNNGTESISQLDFNLKWNGKDIYAYICFAIIAVGMIGNLTCIINLLSKSMRQHVITTLFVMICVIDNIALFGYLVEILPSFIPEIVLNIWTCKSAYFITTFSSMMSSWIVILTVSERMMYHDSSNVASSVKYSAISNAWKIILMMAIIIAGITLHGFWTITIDTSSNMTCLFNTAIYIKFWFGWWILESCLVSFVPLLIITLLALMMIYNHTKAKSDNYSDESSLNVQDGNTRATLAVTLSFIILVTPESILNIYLKNVLEDYTQMYDISTSSNNTSIELAKLICYGLVLLFHSSKLILLICFNKQFTKQLLGKQTYENGPSYYEEDEFEYLDYKCEDSKSKKSTASSGNSVGVQYDNKAYENQEIEVPEAFSYKHPLDAAILSRNPSTISKKPFTNILVKEQNSKEQRFSDSEQSGNVLYTPSAISKKDFLNYDSDLNCNNNNNNNNNNNTDPECFSNNSFFDNIELNDMKTTAALKYECELKIYQSIRCENRRENQVRYSSPSVLSRNYAVNNTNSLTIQQSPPTKSELELPPPPPETYYIYDDGIPADFPPPPEPISFA